MDITDWETTKLRIFNKLDMTVKEIIPLGGSKIYELIPWKIDISFGYFWKKLSEVIINVTTKKVHWDWGEIIDFEESLLRNSLGS